MKNLLSLLETNTKNCPNFDFKYDFEDKYLNGKSRIVMTGGAAPFCAPFAQIIFDSEIELSSATSAYGAALYMKYCLDR